MKAMLFQHMELVVLTLAVFSGAFIGTTAVRFLATRFGWFVQPREDRWHKKPTALHGGAGFYPAFVGGVVWVLVRKYDLAWLAYPSFAEIPKEIILSLAMLTGSLVMFVLGLFDDLKQFRPMTKLLCQLLAASLFIYAGGVFTVTEIKVIDMLITYFWFVGIINAVNMLDNMDGLSSGVVILAGITIIVLTGRVHGIAFDNLIAVPLGLVFVAAIFGFWLHNRPPASIFMGDSGSLFIGYVLAALTVPSTMNGFMDIYTSGRGFSPALVLLIPVTILAIPIFDTTLVTITRTWRSQKASQGGKDHSSHRLVGLGLSEKKAVWVLYLLAAFGGAIAVLMQQFTYLSLPLFGLFVLVLALTGVYLGRVKLEITQDGKTPPVWTPLVSDILYKRHAAEILLDTVLIAICFFGGYFLRNDGNIPLPIAQVMVSSLPLVIACCLLVCYLAGIYQSPWHLISVHDILRYIVAVFGGTVLSLAVVTLITRFGEGHSRSAYIIFGMLFFVAIVGTRLSFRLFDALIHNGSLNKNSDNRIPVLIYGAGKAGKLLLEEAIYNPQMDEYAIVGFIDDDKNRIGNKLCGLPVKRGNEWVRQHWDSLPEIWISSRFVPDRRAQKLVEQWDRQVKLHRLKFQIEPLLNGKIEKNESANTMY